MVEAEQFYDDLADPWVIPNQGYAKRQHAQINYNAALDVSSHPALNKKAALWCSLGSASCVPSIIEKLISVGMNVACIDTSYTTEEASDLINVIHQAEESRNCSQGISKWISIALETTGPTILTGGIDGGEARVKKGDNFKLTTDKAYYDKGDSGVVYIDYDNIHNILHTDNRIFIMDGTISLLVTNFHGSNIICTVECDGVLKSWRNVFLPNIDFVMPSLSDVDQEKLQCGIELGIDIIMAGRVRDASDVLAIREFIAPLAPTLQIFARIECFQALQNFDAIMEVSDGIMINRTCIGVEIPAEKVFIVQKNLINRCLAKGVTVVAAKEFTSSMENKVRPMRTESIDTANAIIDGADGLWISTTARSRHPVKCLNAAIASCIEAEAAISEFNRFRELVSIIPGSIMPQTLAASAVEAAYMLHAAAIVVYVSSGIWVRMLAMYKPNVPIIAVASNVKQARTVASIRCVIPVVYTDLNDGFTPQENWRKFLQTRLDYAINFGKINGIVRSGDPIVLVHSADATAGVTNVMRIVYVSDIVEPISY